MPLRVGIIGSGSLGLFFGHRLSIRGAQVTLVNRKNKGYVGKSLSAPSTATRVTISIVDQHNPTGRGAEVDVISGLVRQPNCSPVNSPFDIVLLTVKHKDTLEASKSIRKGFEFGYLSADSVCISLQNGMGNTEILKHQLQDLSHPPLVLQGLTYTGVSKQSAYEARLNGLGETFVGLPNTSTPEDSQITPESLHSLYKFSEFLGAHLTENIDDIVWTKLLVNSIINPITAILNLPNQSVADKAYLYGMVKEACDEFQLVAEAEKIKLQLDGKSPFEFVTDVAKATGSNVSSMLSDIRQGNITEIEALNGYIVAKAEQHCIQVPVQKSLYTLIKSIEKGFGK